MSPRLSVSPAGYALIESFEGFRALAGKLPEGRWTLGYGHTASAREGARVTRADARMLLKWDLAPVERLLNTEIYAPLNQNQFDALASFVFNIGIEAFRDSDVAARLAEGNMIAAAGAMAAWRRGRLGERVLVVDALVRRRAAEAALFLAHPGGAPVAPSPVLRPELDVQAALTTPRDGASVARVPMDGPLEVEIAPTEPKPVAPVIPPTEPADAPPDGVIDPQTRAVGEVARRFERIFDDPAADDMVATPVAAPTLSEPDPVRPDPILFDTDPAPPLRRPVETAPLADVEPHGELIFEATDPVASGLEPVRTFPLAPPANDVAPPPAPVPANGGPAPVRPAAGPRPAPGYDARPQPGEMRLSGIGPLVLALLGAIGVGAGMWLETRGAATPGGLDLGPLLIIAGIVLVAVAVIRLMTSPKV